VPVSEAPAAHCRDLVVEYRTVAGVARALGGVSASFAPGRLSVVAGPSGSGKSSLLRVLAGLHRPTSGEAVVDGVDLARLRPGAVRRLRRRVLGVVLQAPADNLVEHLDARSQVALSARLRGADPEQSDALLDAVGLGARARSMPGELSGGEQQRVAFAAAAVGAPRVVLADEPTAQLDDAAGVALVATMRALVDRGTTLVVTSHDATVIDAADDVVSLHDGEVVA
jgi:ABC-type lipoprotein export system ATPase subunit